MCRVWWRLTPLATRWHFVVDNLDIHRSESLVRWVADVSDLACDLGEKGKRGILPPGRRGPPFSATPSHRIVFHYTPKHCSWLNQIEIWLGIFARKLLNVAPSSRWMPSRQVLAFIDYYNRTMAKPFKWTYQGKPLTV